ncbi:MAG: hypothetical protein HQL46_08675 [Gammaproteobacteria bacterium]|nr:hypothetical protein [Gammaproteobacteria bacterium]
MSSYIIDILGLAFIVALAYNILLRRDKSNLTEYVCDLKKNVKKLKNKLVEADIAVNDKDNDKLFRQLKETKDHIEVSFQSKYGDHINNAKITSCPAGDEQFLYVLANQSIDSHIELKNFPDEQFTVEHAWKIFKNKLNHVISDLHVIQSTEYEQITEEANNYKKIKSSVSQKSEQERQHEIKLENARTVEISRLKDQLNDSSDTISLLQNELARKDLNYYDEETVQRLAKGLAKVKDENQNFNKLIEVMQIDIKQKDTKLIELDNEYKSSLTTLEEVFTKMVSLEAAIASKINSEDEDIRQEGKEIKAKAIQIAGDLAERIKALEEKVAKENAMKKTKKG